MKKITILASLLSLMASKPTFAHRGTTAETSFSVYNVTFPTTTWISNADVSWYNTTATSFNISTAEQLAGLAMLVNNGNNFSGKTIVLTADINLEGNLWEPIGNTIPAAFSGVFDGNGKTVSNLYINAINKELLGLFGHAKEATVKNTNVENAVIRGKGTAGAIVGNLSTNATLENCHAINVDVEVFETENLGTGYTAGSVVGGALTDCVIRKCSGTGRVKGFAQIGGFIGSPWDKVTLEECSFRGEVIGNSIIGGFIGFTTFAMLPNREVETKNCFAVAVVSGEDMIGGFYGVSQMGIVNNCYAVSTVNAVGTKGSFIGIASGLTTISNAFYNQEVSTLDGAGVVEQAVVSIEGKTTSDMKTQSFVDTLNNNTDVWAIIENKNEGYPAFESTLNKNTFEMVSVSVYPNPTTDILHIDSSNRVVSYQVVDLNGRVIMSGNDVNSSINVSHLSSGNYLLVLYTTNGNTVKKIVKK